MRLSTLCVVLVVSCLSLEAAAAGAQPYPPSNAALELARDLHRDLTALLREAHAVRGAGLGSGASGRLDALLAAIDRVRADHLLSAGAHEGVEQRLQSAGASTAAQRHAVAATERQRRLDALQRLFDDISTAAGPPVDSAGLRAALDALVSMVQEAVAAPDRVPLGASLPYRPLHLAAAVPATQPAIVPAYLDPQLRAPEPQDSAASPDVPLDEDIVAQARALRQSPIDIYQFVANEIGIEFYHGAMKGARATLQQRRGNDIDQASLLIALMRASGVPARYVRGVIELTAAQMFEWTGVSSTQRVTELLTHAGIPHRAVRQGGVVAAYQIEHTWVEVSVAYANYRGAPLDPRTRSWIPLDPSIKSYQFAPGLDVLPSIGFTADALLAAYLSGPQSLSPLAFYTKAITDYLTENRPGVAFADAVAKWALQPTSPGLLPNTLPYKVMAITSETAALSDALRHHVRVVAQGDDGVSFDVTLAASDVLGQRLTLSYVPATVDDQIAVDAFLTLDNTPAYLVKLRPVLKVGGVVRAGGELAIQMGALHDVTIELQSPAASISIDNALVAGGYYAVALGSSGFTWQPPPTPAPDDTERPAADLLFGLAASYISKWNEAEDTVASIFGAAVVRPMLSEVMVGNSYNRTVLFGVPQAIEWRGVFVDADLRIAEPVANGSDAAIRSEVLSLSALAGSVLESEILETALQVDSVSAAKLIQLAHAAGIPVNDVTAGNAAALLPTIATADVVKTHIADLVNQGFQVTVPLTDVTVNQWTGIGYIARDPLTAAAGYFISGALAGGMTTLTPEQWVLQELATQFSQPYTGPPNTNASEAASITKISSTDKQQGKPTQTLPAALAVWVRDGKGKPVQSAQVTFLIKTSVPSGGAEFPFSTVPQSQEIVVQTDSLGIARAVLRLGQRTSDYPLYLKVNPNDFHPTQIGQTLVTATVATAQGLFSIDAPFQLLTYPDAPHHIRKVLGDGESGYPGTYAGTLSVRVEDQYDNPVSNVPVNFFVGPAATNPPLIGSLPAGARNMVVYPSDPPCLSSLGIKLLNPLLDDCNGQPSVTGVLSGVFGASVEAILGDTVGTLFTVDVKGLGVPPQTFTLTSTGARAYGAGVFLQPTLAMSLVQLRTDRDANNNATKAGTMFARPLGVVLYLLEDNYELQRIATPCPAPPSACYKVVSKETTRVRAIDIQLAGSIAYPQASPLPPVEVDKVQETAKVTFTLLGGNGTVTPDVISQQGLNYPALPAPSTSPWAQAGPAQPGMGQYYSRLTTATFANLNRVQVAAEATVWVPCFDLQTGTVHPKPLEKFKPGQRFANAIECSDAATQPAASGEPANLTHEVFGVKAAMWSMARPVVPMSVSGGTAIDVALNYTIEPAAYAGQLAQVDLFEVDPATSHENWIGTFNGQERSGTSSATMFQGTGLDATRLHKMRLVLNRGSEAEITGDLVPTAVFAYAKVGEVRSNQIPGVRANYLPGGSGGRCSSSCLPYIMVGARDDGQLHVDADVDFLAPPASIRAGLLKLAGSDEPPALTLTGAGANDLARVVFATDAEDHVVVMGVDADGNGVLRDGEIVARSPAIIRAVSQAAYDHNLLKVKALVIASAAFFPSASSVLGTFAGMFPVPIGATAQDDQIESNNGLLTHNTGVYWEPTPTTLFDRYVFPARSVFAAEILTWATMPSVFRSNVVTKPLENGALQVLAALANLSKTTTTVTVPLPVDTPVTFAHPELFLGFQGSHFKGTLEVTVERTSTCASLQRVVVKGSLTDLYDFEYEQTGAPRAASIVQAGYPTLGAAGAIFRNEVQLDGGVPFVFFDFDSAPGAASLCSQVKVP